MKSASGGPEEGDAAPDFELQSSEGGTVRLSSLRGKKVVVYFYPADDTPGCTREACSFRDNMPKFTGVKAAVFGVSQDDMESHRKFIAKYGLNFPLLSDPDLVAHKAYGTWKLKSMYGREFWGTERSTFIVDEKGKVAKAWRKVKVDGHDAEVLKALGA